MGGRRARRALLFLAGLVAALAVMPAAASAQAQYRVISGQGVPITAAPFQVRVEIKENDPPLGTFECGGSIVDATHVVTAAHCVTNELGHNYTLPPDITVFYGSASQSQQVSSHLERTVSAYAVPPQYTQLVGADQSYDVAVLTVPALPISSTVRPIPLANPRQPKAVGNSFVSGWGLTDSADDTSSPDGLRGVRLRLQPNAPCSNEYGTDYVAARAVCAGGGTRASQNPDTCQGDSGGPIAVDLDNSTGATRYVLLGITSFGADPCGQRGIPGVYTWTQGAGVRSFIDANSSATTSAQYTSGNFEGIAPAPAPKPAPAPDTIRPKARITAIKCKRRKCAFRVRTSDRGGSVRKLSAKVTRRVRKCKRVRGSKRKKCRTRTRTKRLKPHRIRHGYRMTARLRVARYKLSAVATDTSRNRSKTAKKRFRVRRR